MRRAIQSGQEDQSYGNSLFDALQAVLGDVGGYQNTALQQKQTLAQATVNALEAAYQNYLAHPELGGYGQNPNPTPAASPAVTPEQLLTAASHNVPDTNKVGNIISFLSRGLS